MVDQDQLYLFHFNSNEEDKEKGFRRKEYPNSTATIVLKREPNLKWFFAVINYSKVICLVLSIIIIGSKKALDVPFREVDHFLPLLK